MHSITSFPTMCRVLAKRHLRRPSFFLTLALALLLQVLLGTFVFPDTENTRIGIMSNNGGPVCEDVIRAIMTAPSAYNYVEYGSLPDMRADVSTGKLDCAFIFDGRMETVTPDSIENAFTFVSSTTSSKGFLIKEEVFSIVLRELSGRFLKNMAYNGSILISPSEEAAAAFEDTYKGLRDSDRVLSVFFVDAASGENIDITGGNNDDGTGAASVGRSSASAALVPLILFAAALFFAAGRFRDDTLQMWRALRFGAGRRFIFADTFMPLVILAVPLIAVCALQGGLSGISPLRIALIPVLLLPATALWAVVFARITPGETICLFAS
ncbi:MAG: hypothetical protein Q4G47_04375, partial [Lachnospiraceae bacterium]|nr:hypothetical protein [Lachnospiraceae bacterium]